MATPRSGLLFGSWMSDRTKFLKIIPVGDRSVSQCLYWKGLLKGEGAHNSNQFIKSHNRHGTTLTDSFLFLHIPRTGGTNIERSLSLAVTGKWFPELDHHSGLMDAHLLPGLGREHQHWKMVDVKKVGRVVPDFRFSIVRNPWSWVVSEIAYFRSKGVLFEVMSWKEAIWKFVGTPAMAWGVIPSQNLWRTILTLFASAWEIQCKGFTRQPSSPVKSDFLNEINDEAS